MIVLLPILVMLAGAMVYLLVASAKAQELGRIAFAVGLFFTVYEVAHSSVRILAG